MYLSGYVLSNMTQFTFLKDLTAWMWVKGELERWFIEC